jgi:hypothetical protein
MLLMDDEYDFGCRPLRLSSCSGVFREDGRSKNRQGAATKGKRDRWLNSGGKQGSSIWPTPKGSARVRCQYGKVDRSDRPDTEGVGQPDTCRYHMYTLVDGGLREIAVFGCSHFLVENDHLPRQTRDNRKENHPLILCVATAADTAEKPTPTSSPELGEEPLTEEDDANTKRRQIAFEKNRRLFVVLDPENELARVRAS